MTTELRTTILNGLLARFQAGDPAALEELLRRAYARMERLARAMLRRYPPVRQREQTADVVQLAALSLIGALRELKFSSTRDFFGLAAEHIRRRLVDLNRYHSQPHRNHAALAAAGEAAQVPATRDEDLERWAALHEAVEQLPPDQREVFSLRFYHGWSVEEVAELLQVSTRTVTRLWVRAQIDLTKQIGGRLPGEDD